MKRKEQKPKEEVDVDKAIKDFKKMLLATHEIKNTKPYYDYKGQEITESCILAISSNIKDSVSEDGMDYHRDRGRDMIDVILLNMFQLGYNQAVIRKHNEEIQYGTNRDMIDLLMDEIKELKKK